MLISIVSLILSAIGFQIAEQCRRNPEQLAKRFITKQGQPLSIFALPYLGRPDEGRQAIVQYENLRKIRLYELYFWSTLLLIFGLWQLLI